MSSILGKRFDGWCCLPLEMHGQMPCHVCPRFDRSTLECVGCGLRVSNDVLNELRDRYVPAIEAIEVVDEEHEER